MKNLYFGLLILPSLIFGQTETYYFGTENLSGYQLKSKLHDIISNKPISWNYGDLPNFYAITDVDRYYENNGSLLDIYSEIPDGPDAYEYNFSQMIGTASQEAQGWNREHGMPQSTFNSNYPMYSDLFFVIPTDARINQLRSNYPYGIVGNASYTFTNGSKQGTNAIPNSTYGERAYEPIDEFKGDVARMLLYYAVRYEGKLGTFNYSSNAMPSKDRNPMDGTEERAYEKWYIDMLISWHNLDPVSQREIDRNNYVYTIQKNRNPFVDHPEWVDSIWNQTSDNVAPQAISALSVTKNSAYFTSLQWQASPDADVIGYEIYQNGTLIAKTKSTNFTVDRLSPSTTYTYHIIAYDNAYLKSAQSNTLSVTTLDSDVYSKDLFISKYIEGSGNNRALEITNLTGHEVDLQGYRLGIQMKGSVYYFAEALELEGVVPHGQSFVAINPNANLSCYTTSNAKIQSAAPALQFTGKNYVELNFKNFTVDAIGTKGEDNANADKSLYRLASITEPNTTFALSEWQSYPIDYCQDLGVLTTQEFVAKAHTQIYPNPVFDILNIKSDTKISQFQILDTSGRVMKTGILNSKNNAVNVSDLATGVYFLKLDNQVQQFIKK